MTQWSLLPVEKQYSIGDPVWYSPAWGNERPVPTTITSVGEKNGQTVYSNDLELWGYAYQYEYRAD